MDIQFNIKNIDAEIYKPVLIELGYKPTVTSTTNTVEVTYQQLVDSGNDTSSFINEYYEEEGLPTINAKWS